MMDADKTVLGWSRDNGQLLPNDARATAGFGSLDTDTYNPRDASASRLCTKRRIIALGTAVSFLKWTLSGANRVTVIEPLN